MDTTKDQEKASKAFDEWFESEETQKSFNSSQATERDIASSSFFQGFEFAQSLRDTDFDKMVAPLSRLNLSESDIENIIARLARSRFQSYMIHRNLPDTTNSDRLPEPPQRPKGRELPEVFVPPFKSND